MTATVPDVTAWAGRKKYQTARFLLNRMCVRACACVRVLFNLLGFLGRTLLQGVIKFAIWLISQSALLDVAVSCRHYILSVTDEIIRNVSGNILTGQNGSNRRRPCQPRSEQIPHGLAWIRNLDSELNVRRLPPWAMTRRSSGCERCVVKLLKIKNRCQFQNTSVAVFLMQRVFPQNDILRQRKRPTTGPCKYLLTYTMVQSPSWEANWFCS